jgi:hypothetical protein
MQAQTKSEKITCFSPFSGWWSAPFRSVGARKMGGKWRGGCADKKENQVFLICKEIQNGAVAKFLRRPLVIYDFVTAPF